MKIAYKNILDRFKSNPSIEEISNKLFQLGHENEIQSNIIDIELTPNRGDCLSVNGLVRDLSVFYEKIDEPKIYDGDFNNLFLDFDNHDKDTCTNISFLKIEIENKKQEIKYKGNLFNYFKEFNLNKNNIFTDISNYISYETGQPTHCFDYSKIRGGITFKNENIEKEFETLFGKKITLKGKNAFFESTKEIISLAGVIGGNNTSCSSLTDTVLIECAHFAPEEIIGKSLKYDIQSDAAYKFERGVDPLCHDYVLRRFVSILEQHTSIRSLEIYKKEFKPYLFNEIKFDLNLINKIIGTKLNHDDCISILTKLGFNISNDLILVPSYRSDVKNHNDLAEEISRVIGYDNIEATKINLPFNKVKRHNHLENSIKGILVNNGFYEIINNPFVNKNEKNSIKVDNPIDTNKKFVRQNLKNSLIDKMLYNEKRQKDSVKLFEISNTYYLEKDKVIETKKIGIIASGRIDKNYEDFSKKIDEKYISSILDLIGLKDIYSSIISRESLESKNRNKIIYAEIDFADIKTNSINTKNITLPPKDFNKYVKISEFPSSIRDLSFSVYDANSLEQLQELILNFSDPLLKETFIFDFYNNQEKELLKIGFRFIFQSPKRTIKDEDVENVINDIIDKALLINKIEIPGLKK